MNGQITEVKQLKAKANSKNIGPDGPELICHCNVYLKVNCACGKGAKCEI